MLHISQPKHVTYFSTKTIVLGTQNNRHIGYFQHPKQMFKLMVRKYSQYKLWSVL